MANTITKGAIAVSLNADQLYKGMKTAATKTDKAFTDIKKSADKQGGSFFSSLNKSAGSVGGLGLGKALAIGTGVGAALLSVELLKKGFEGVSHAVEFVVGKVDEFKKGIQEGTLKNLTPHDLQGLSKASDGMERINYAVERLTVKLVSALGPAFEMIANAIDDWSPYLTPLVESVGNALGDVLSIALELVDGFTNGMGDVIQSTADWINKTFDLGLQWKGFYNLFKEVAKGIAQVWNYTINGTSYAWHSFTEKFLSGLATIADAVGLDELGKSLTKASQEQGALAFKDIDDLVREQKQAEAAIDGFFNRAQARRDKAAKDVKNLELKLEYKPVGADVFNTSKAASSIAKFTTEALIKNPQNIAQQQLQVGKQQLAVLQTIDAQLRKPSYEFGLI